MLTVAKNKSIEDALNEVLNKKTLSQIVKDVTVDVGKKALKDLREESNKIVKHYYDSYTPEVYDRIYALYNSFYYFNTTRGQTVHVGVTFDPKKIEGLHESTSRYHKEGDKWTSIDWIHGGPEKGKQYVEASYIMNNFWEGIHPRYKWVKGQGYVENHKKDELSPATLMQKFVDNYQDIATEYAVDVFTQKILETLKQ